MKKLLSIILFAAAVVPLLTSCGESVELDYLSRRKADSDRKAPHALLIYFVGTSLDSYFAQNIAGVLSAVDQNILGDCRIAYFRRVETGSADWGIFEISYDVVQRKAVTTMLKIYEDADLTQIGTYLSDMVGLVPAESYGLVLGGHGSGWLPKDVGTSWSNTYSVRPQTPYVMPFGEAPREDALPTRFFGERAVMFDLEDISAGMEESGGKYEYMLFDDCFMSNIESLYALRHAADYIIASPCEVMAAGFPYKLVVPQLFKNGRRDLEGVCRAFYEYYEGDSGCVALTVCSELEPLAEAYANLLAGETNAVDRTGLQYYEGLSEHLFYDFGQYAELLSADDGLYGAFREQFDRAFPESCRLHTPTF